MLPRLHSARPDAAAATQSLETLKNMHNIKTLEELSKHKPKIAHVDGNLNGIENENLKKWPHTHNRASWSMPPGI